MPAALHKAEVYVRWLKLLQESVGVAVSESNR